ncbi:hypothetical protein PV327_004868 [Microctonus hyperodae]|uniref:Major facilitator superfamily (MFS) profile domain-containing protein n=1 Tax=Microctonus hyperodae TaxID=165561 RepID=A0AA39FDH7_MICHY|nr:hypothetical protein PV327_004868 [Microctonus hyperodae]
MDNEVTLPVSKWRRFTYVEPPIFLSFVVYGMTGVVFSDLIIFQTCKTIIKTNENCDIIHTNSSSQAAFDLDKLIQPKASYILMYQSLLEGALSAFLSLFLGPWSDKYGRRPVLLIGYIASTCKSILLSILTLWNINPWLFLFASIPSGLLGASSGIILGTMCYISDITNNNNRAWRLGCLQAIYLLGLIIGTFIGPLVFKKFGYTSLFCTAAVFNSISLFYTFIYVPETIHSETNQKWKYLFDVKLVKDLFATSVKKRLGLNRISLWCCIVILLLHVVLMEGHGRIGFLFANAKLGWDAIYYSIYIGISMILTIIGTILALSVFRHYFGFSDATGAMIGTLSGFACAMTLSFTTKPWHMYFGMSIGIFSAIVSPTIRSILSKSAPAEDTGKVFSLTTFLETLLPVAGSSLYSVIYSAYMPPIYPSPAYLLSGGIYFIILVLVIVVDREMIRHQPIIESHNN